MQGKSLPNRRDNRIAIKGGACHTVHDKVKEPVDKGPLHVVGEEGRESY